MVSRMSLKVSKSLRSNWSNKLKQWTILKKNWGIQYKKGIGETFNKSHTYFAHGKQEFKL